MLVNVFPASPQRLVFLQLYVEIHAHIYVYRLLYIIRCCRHLNNCTACMNFAAVDLHLETVILSFHGRLACTHAKLLILLLGWTVVNFIHIDTSIDMYRLSIRLLAEETILTVKTQSVNTSYQLPIIRSTLT